MSSKVEHKRETFSGKMGFILASVGACVGLRNIWMFHGGLANTVVLLFSTLFFFVFVLCSIGLMGEFAFGRS